MLGGQGNNREPLDKSTLRSHPASHVGQTVGLFLSESPLEPICCRDVLDAARRERLVPVAETLAELDVGLIRKPYKVDVVNLPVLHQLERPERGVALSVVKRAMVDAWPQHDACMLPPVRNVTEAGVLPS